MYAQVQYDNCNMKYTSVFSWIQTFSLLASVSTNVEKTGRGCWALADQHSIEDPMGRQNWGTSGGRGKFS